MGSETFSSLCGWVSIGCWLGAQFPQVVENIRRQSCEGLALPFLTNWLLGDFSNLIGCILTHQLPFQRILATYFCSVDLVLFIQYFYYSSKALSTGSYPDDIASRYAQSRRIAADPAHAHVHYREISNAAADLAVVAAIAAEDEVVNSPIIGRHGHVVRSRTTSTVGPHKMRAPVSSDGTLVVSPTSITNATSSKTNAPEDEWQAEEEDEVDENALAALADSFHSERAVGRKRVSWSQDRGSFPRSGRSQSTSPLIGLRPSLPSHQRISTMEFPTSTNDTGASGSGLGLTIGEHDILKRGRPLRRQVDSPIDMTIDDSNIDLERQALLGTSVTTIRASTRDTAHTTTSTNTSTARRNSRASKRSAGLVFLGVWALFGVGGLGQQLRQRSVPLNKGTGAVLNEVDAPAEWPSPAYSPTSRHHEAFDPSNLDMDRGSSDSVSIILDPLPFSEGGDSSQPEEKEESPSMERIIGRISAWTCTTLYLTSRLPQIWKNFVRKSVEGLSMYLFVFAFLGNTFYVLSILTSPNMDLPRPEAFAFLKESVPYLLGSGGTLLFDVTIVLQSFIYKPSSRYAHSHPSKSHSLIHSTTVVTRSRANSQAHSYPQGQRQYSRLRASSHPTPTHARSSSNGSKLSSQVRSLARTRSGSEAPYAGVGGNNYGYEQVRDSSTVPIARSHSEGVSGAPYSSTKRRVVNEEEAPLLGREED